MVVQELLNAHERDELNVSPWYQRRAVWSNAHKSYLLNTIFEIRPVPTLYIRHTIDIEREKTIKEVVDGQQRCRSIIDYRGNGFSARHPEHNQRVFFRDLTATQKEKLLMAKLSVAYLIGANDADVIEIFGRLNAVSKTLNAQEKRAAKWSGGVPSILPSRRRQPATALARAQSLHCDRDITDGRGSVHGGTRDGAC